MNLWRRLLCTARRRSPWLFHMNSGSCNGCDIEIVAALSPRYDAEQLGVRLEGSPRHADILCVTGPVTRRAVRAVKTVYDQVLGPKAVVAIGKTRDKIVAAARAGALDPHRPSTLARPSAWRVSRTSPTTFCRARQSRIAPPDAGMSNGPSVMKMIIPPMILSA